MKKQEKSSGGGIAALLIILLLVGVVFEVGLFSYVGLTVQINRQAEEQRAAHPEMYQSQPSQEPAQSVKYIGPTVHVVNNALIEGEWEPVQPRKEGDSKKQLYTPSPVPKLEIKPYEIKPYRVDRSDTNSISKSQSSNTRSSGSVTDRQNAAPVPSDSGSSQQNNSSSSTSWGESSTTNEITGSLDRTAYWVDGGKSYHFSSGCPSLARSRNIHEGTLQDALNAGKTDPCNNCSGGS